MNIEDIFKTIAPIEKKILQKTLPSFERPWQKEIDPLKSTKNLKIMYPSDEEDCGLVYIGFRGPKATTEYETLTACSIFLKYLSETSVSPLQKELIEIEDPYASRVSFRVFLKVNFLIQLSCFNRLITT